MIGSRLLSVFAISLDHFWHHFRTIVVPKVALAPQVDTSGALGTPKGSQGRPKSTYLEPKVGQGAPPECQMDSRWSPKGAQNGSNIDQKNDRKTETETEQ